MEYNLKIDHEVGYFPKAERKTKAQVVERLPVEGVGRYRHTLLPGARENNEIRYSGLRDARTWNNQSQERRESIGWYLPSLLSLPQDM